MAERLPVPLGKGVREKCAQQLAALLVRIDELEEEKADWVADANAELKELRESVHELAREVHTGVRDLLVDVDEIRNLESGMMDTVRADTGEVIRSRPLTDEERQVTIEDLRQRREGRAPEQLQQLAAGGEEPPMAATAPRSTPAAEEEIEETEAGPEPEVFEVE